jgi:NAD+ kinase
VALRHVGLVVHPTRALETALGELGARASAHGLMVPVSGQTRQVADPVAADDCDLLLALGGDGTVLSALHAAAPTSRPVLGVACGSLGVLTSASVERIAWALDEVATGRWTPMAIAGLDVTWGEAQTAVAINDVAVIRGGPGQIMVSVAVDDVLYAGAGAGRGRHGGHALVGPRRILSTARRRTRSRVTLRFQPGHGGVRCELDGRPSPVEGHLLTIQHRRDYATFVTLDGDEPQLTKLRRRGLVRDSPRALCDVRGEVNLGGGASWSMRRGWWPDARGVTSHRRRSPRRDTGRRSRRWRTT